MKHITTCTRRGTTFEVVQNDEGWYLAIDRRYIDADGCLTKELNGLEMHADKELDRCIDMARQSVDADYYMERYIAQGMDEDMALMKAVHEACAR